MNGGVSNKMSSRKAVHRDLTTIFSHLRWTVPLIVVVLIALYFVSGFYVIKPEEIGVVRRFGRVVAPLVTPGIHYRLPWPIDRLDRIRPSAVRRMSIGFRFLERQAGMQPVSWEVQFLTGDTNILNIQMIIQYIISDPVAYLFNVNDVHFLVRKVAEAAMMEVVGGMGVDEVLTTGKTEIQNYVKKQTQSVLDDYSSGLQIVKAHLQDVNPPEEVAPAFRDVASAKEDKQRKINEAYGYMNDMIPRVRGKADKEIAAAEAQKGVRINEAKGDAQRFLALLVEYEKAPGVLSERIYIGNMEEILAAVKKFIVGQEEGKPSPVRLKLLQKP
jgi:membrane protease subunit HflK